MKIFVKANSVFDLKNGVFALEIDSVPISDELAKSVEKVLPHLHGEFYKLINKEALLGMIATEAEVTAEEQKDCSRCGIRFTPENPETHKCQACRVKNSKYADPVS